MASCKGAVVQQQQQQQQQLSLRQLRVVRTPTPSTLMTDRAYYLKTPAATYAPAVELKQWKQ